MYTDGSNPHTTDGPQPHDLWKKNPNFVDFSNGNYHLRADSPCKDAGELLSEVGKDYDGFPRPQGPGFDMGAYEYKRTIAPPGNLRIVG